MTKTPAVAAVCLLVLATAAPAVAQSVQGDVRDQDRDRPIPGARLHLLGEGGVIADSARADAHGRFRLAAAAAGSYTLYFQLDGWASVPSDPPSLADGKTTEFTFRVPLVSSAAIRQMTDMIAMDERLQTALPEMCGEPLRSWEAGLLVGMVRHRPTNGPVAGARVAVAAADGSIARSTFSSEKGVYILCNVPLGKEVGILIETPDGRTARTTVEIRAGMVSWYDLPVGGVP